MPPLPKRQKSKRVVQHPPESQNTQAQPQEQEDFTHVDSRPLRYASFCSGVGGLDLGFELAVPSARCVLYVEREAYCCEVLVEKMEKGLLAEAPVWADLKTFDGLPWRNTVDCLIGGYPCQPFSIAGKQQAHNDPRHLWPHLARIIGEIQPALCFFENVGNHLRLGFAQVHDDLQQMGYEVAAGLFTAQEVGASHKRERLFILAVGLANSKFQRSQRNAEALARQGTSYSSRDVIDSSTTLANSHRHCSQRQREPGELGSTSAEESSEACQRQRSGNATNHSNREILDNGLDHSDSSRDDHQGFPTAFPPTQGRWLTLTHDSREVHIALDDAAREWCYLLGNGNYPDLAPAVPLEPTLRGMVDGLAPRMERLRACGNGVVPLQSAYAFHILFQALQTTKLYQPETQEEEV